MAVSSNITKKSLFLVGAHQCLLEVAAGFIQFEVEGALAKRKESTVRIDSIAISENYSRQRGIYPQANAYISLPVVQKKKYLHL